MPKPKKKNTVTQENVKYQKETYPARIEAVRERAEAALEADVTVGKGGKRLSVKERGKHQKALKAADRLASRMGLKERKKKATAPTRGAAAGAVEAIKDLANAITSIPGKLKENLGRVAEK